MIEPLCTIPIFVLFIYNYRKAKAQGIITLRNSGRGWLQSLQYYGVQFDLLGLLLIVSGLALFLLPFSLYFYQPSG
jgi:hypothetical protein